MYEYRSGQIVNDLYQLVQELPSMHQYCSLFKAFKINQGEIKDHIFLKIIDKRAFFEGTSFSKSEQKHILQKIKKGYEKMASYSSPCIAHCYACKNSETSLFIELEYLSGGSLLDLAMKYNGFSFNDALIILKQVIFCLQALQQNEEHLFGNLRMSHFVYNNGLLKLANPGYTNIRREKKLLNEQENYLTEPQLFPPEIIYNENDGKVKSDIWSLGALFFALLNWKKYNGIFTHKQIVNFISEKKEPRVESIIAQSLKKKPAQRIQLGQLKEEISDLIKKEEIPITLFIFPKDYEENENLGYSFNTLEEENIRFSHFENPQANIEIDEKIEKASQSYGQSLKLFSLIQRCEYVYKYIIKQLSNSQWANSSKKQKKFQEIMYLFYARIFIDMSNIRIEVQKLQCEKIKQDFQRYFKYPSISRMFNKVGQELTKYENSFFEKFLWNPINFVFNKQKKKIKDKFLTGIQGVDYNREEQIQFTQGYIKQIFDVKDKNSQHLPAQLYERLKLYKQINNYSEIQNIFNHYEKKIAQKFR